MTMKKGSPGVSLSLSGATVLLQRRGKLWSPLDGQLAAGLVKSLYLAM